MKECHLPDLGWSYRQHQRHTTWLVLCVTYWRMVVSNNKHGKVATTSNCFIFFRGCVPEMFVTSYAVAYCIYVPGKPGICFYYSCAVYDRCKYLDTFWPAERTRLFVQYTISLSSLRKLIWRHWTYKMPVRYILSSVWVRLIILSRLSIIQYVGLNVFSLPIYLAMIGRIYIFCLIIIIK